MDMAGVYGDYDSGDGRVAGEPGLLYPLSLPECVFVFVDELGVYLLAAYACAVVLVDYGVEECGGEVILVVEGGASCDVYAWSVGEGFDKLDGLGGCGDDGPGSSSEAQSECEVVPCLAWVLPRCELVAPSGVELWASKLVGFVA